MWQCCDEPSVNVPWPGVRGPSELSSNRSACPPKGGRPVTTQLRPVTATQVLQPGQQQESCSAGRGTAVPRCGKEGATRAPGGSRCQEGLTGFSVTQVHWVALWSDYHHVIRTSSEVTGTKLPPNYSAAIIQLMFWRADLKIRSLEETCLTSNS